MPMIDYCARARNYAAKCMAAYAAEQLLKAPLENLKIMHAALKKQQAEMETPEVLAELADMDAQIAAVHNSVAALPFRANKWVALACARQTKDLARKRFKYRFDEDRGNRICKFVELLPHTKGIWAKEKRLITLEDWQVFILSTVFGWIDAQGNRRFRKTYKEIPRKNAKSTISSGVGLYMLSADGEGGPEVYSAATTKDQAKIVWQDAHRMADRSAGLRSRFKVSTSAHSIFTGDGGLFKALARDQGGNLDGLNVHCAIIDELHAHKTREVVEVIDTATGSRSQPLIWQITTAGFNRTTICYETRAYCTKVLSGMFSDDRFFGIIYSIDEDDDWGQPSCWAKANPNWGVSVNPEDVTSKGLEALKVTAKQNGFLTKHLNVWVNAATAWMDMKAWDAAGDVNLKLSDFDGAECIAAVDLATKDDIAALVVLFRREDHYYLFPYFWLPEAAAEGQENAHYAGWAKDGQLNLSAGNVTDHNAVQERVRQIAAKHVIQSLAYDSWQAHKFATELAEEGMAVLEYRNDVRHFSGPMKELKALVMSGKLTHTGSPVMGWMMSNVVAILDAKDNIYPRKEMPRNKIDGPVAAIMALGRLLKGDSDPSEYIYVDRPILEV